MSRHQNLGIATLKSNECKRKSCKGNFVPKLSSSHVILFKGIFVNVRVREIDIVKASLC